MKVYKKIEAIRGIFPNVNPVQEQGILGFIDCCERDHLENNKALIKMEGYKEGFAEGYEKGVKFILNKEKT